MNRTIKNILVFIPIIIFLLALFLGLMHYITNENPKIHTMIELRNISKEEYYTIPDFNEYNIKNIKKLYLQVDILDSANSKIRDINIPDLNILDKIDGIRSFSCSSSEINNKKSNSAQSIKYTIFNSDGLSISKLKNVFADKNIYIIILTKGNRKIELKYNVGKLLKES